MLGRSGLGQRALSCVRSAHLTATSTERFSVPGPGGRSFFQDPRLLPWQTGVDQRDHRTACDGPPVREQATRGARRGLSLADKAKVMAADAVRRKKKRSVSHWPGPWYGNLSCCCSMNPSVPSTPSPGSRCTHCCSLCAGGTSRRYLLVTPRRRRGDPLWPIGVIVLTDGAISLDVDVSVPQSLGFRDSHEFASLRPSPAGRTSV